MDPWSLWVAEERSPGVPLAVVRKNRVVSANRGARACGVEVGMKEAGAKARLPDLMLIPYDSVAVQRRWEGLLEELYGQSLYVEAIRSGRVLLRMPETVARQLAEAYWARAGIAATRETAELAAVSAALGEARVVADEEAFLGKLPLYFLRGVGLSERSQAGLERLAVRTVGQLVSWGRRKINAYLEEAPVLMAYLHGPRRDQVAKYVPRETLEAVHIFEEPALEPLEYEPVLRRLSEYLARRLRTGGRSARRLSLTAQAGGLEG